MAVPRREMITPRDLEFGPLIQSTLNCLSCDATLGVFQIRTFHGEITEGYDEVESTALKHDPYCRGSGLVTRRNKVRLEYGRVNHCFVCSKDKIPVAAFVLPGCEDKVDLPLESENF